MGYGNTAKDGTGSFWHDLLNAAGMQYSVDGKRPLLVSDVTADDSDKSFTVPAGYDYEIENVYIKLTTTATVGNRQITLEITDGANVLAQFRAGIVQAASLTRYYTFAPGAIDMVAFRDTDYLSNPIPRLLLPPTYVLRVYDKTAVAAAADDMEVRILFLARQV